jgi:PAS domain S-box-containing protein
MAHLEEGVAMDASLTDPRLRDSGIHEIGHLAWGAHVCQFYEDRSDLLDILVPYFRSGLLSNEYCMWVTSEPLGVDDAAAALRKAVPDLDERIRRGQIEFLPHDRWYLENGVFDFGRVLRGWEARVGHALARGYDGMRVSGNTAWLEKARWDDFTQYEAAINGTIGRLHMMAICTYAVDRCGAKEVIDVVGNHQFALVKRGDSWQAVEDSQRKRMAEALSQSERRLRLLFDHMTSGCAYHQVVLDERQRPVDYVFVEVNAAFERQTGLRREQILGKRVTEVLPGIESDEFDWIGTYGRVATTGEPARFERRSGQLGRWYSVSAYSPAPGSFVALIDDVTDRRVAEEQREDLVRAVTHDLRTPLSVVASAATLMRRKQEAPPARVDTILRSCAGMDAMLNDLADMVRLDAGPITLDRRQVDVGALLSDLLPRLSAALDVSRVRISVCDPAPTVDGDAHRLERVLVNLLTNALKYSPPGTPVVVEVREARGQVAVDVSDEGEGIDAADLPHVFDRFFRTKTARRTEGLGLGLYIARTLVEAHGGTVEVDSRPGRTRFRVLLPRAAAVAVA